MTGLIIGRIYYRGRLSAAVLRSGVAINSPRSYLQDAMGVVIESGLVYLVVQLILTILFAINHPAQIILADVATQIYVSTLPSSWLCSKLCKGNCTNSHFCPCWSTKTTYVSNASSANKPRREDFSSQRSLTSSTFTKLSTGPIVVQSARAVQRGASEYGLDSYELKSWKEESVVP